MRKATLTLRKHIPCDICVEPRLRRKSFAVPEEVAEQARKVAGFMAQLEVIKTALRPEIDEWENDLRYNQNVCAGCRRVLAG